MTTHFENLKQHFVENKVAVFNHLIDNTFDIPAIRVYSLNRNNLAVKNTRKAGKGAHFRVTCWRQSKDLGAYESYIYWTRASSTFKGQRFSTIPTDKVNNLGTDCKIVFENGYRFSKPVTLSFVKKYDMIKLNGNMQYVIPMKDLVWLDPDFKEREAFDYSKFQPEYIANYAIHHDNHCKELNVKMIKNGEEVVSHFDSVKQFFETVLESHGAKLCTVKDMIRKERNFTFDGVTFVFNEVWEMVEYKIRKRVIIESIVETLDETEVDTVEVQVYEKSCENEKLVSVVTKDTTVNNLIDLFDLVDLE